MSTRPPGTRYRVVAMTFDSRALILRTQIRDEWTPDAKRLWRQNQEATERGIADEYGPTDLERKLSDLKDLGPAPFSVVSYHNRYLSDVRRAFVAGAHYAALTGACSLGERLINEVVLRLRQCYTHAPEYGAVASGKSVQWRVGVRALDSWGVLVPGVAGKLLRLYECRNGAVHYSAQLSKDVRGRSLRAMRLVQEVVQSQFGGFGSQPWYIRGIAGASFVRSDSESDPFVREFILPSCVAVSPLYRMEPGPNGWTVIDEEARRDVAVTDEEFAAALAQLRGVS